MAGDKRKRVTSIKEEEEEDEDGEEFVAKVGGTFSIFYPTGGGICMLWHKSTTLVLTHFFGTQLIDWLNIAYNAWNHPDFYFKSC